MAYRMTSWPDAVACNSGSAARRPVMIMRATEREAEELKLREAWPAVRTRPRVGRRGVKADIGVRQCEMDCGMLRGENDVVFSDSRGFVEVGVVDGDAERVPGGSCDRRCIGVYCLFSKDSSAFDFRLMLGTGLVFKSHDYLGSNCQS